MTDKEFLTLTTITMKNKLSFWWAIAWVLAMIAVGQAVGKCRFIPLVGWVDCSPENEELLPAGVAAGNGIYIHDSQRF